MDPTKLSQLFVTSLLALAGNSRLPPKLSIKNNTEPINQHEANIKMESDVHNYTKSVSDFNI